METPSPPSPDVLADGAYVTCGACGKPGKYSADGGLHNRDSVIHGEESGPRPSHDKATSKVCLIFLPKHRAATVPLPPSSLTSSSSPLPNAEFPRGTEGTGASLSMPAPLTDFADLNSTEG